ncbi:vWA domain-containing protein [Trueperella pyogenes]|uniref:vWA domain-containing protein n=1 Tax=Trueperella pyogenes TaxID=1661 RepID=UPI0031330C7D
MVNPILGGALGVVLVAVAVAGWFRRRPGGVRVAHTRTALQHPRLRKRLAMLQVALVSVVVLAIFAAGAGAYLAGRPAAMQSRADELAKRDIMLCLDVSGSVLDHDAEVLRAFSTLVDSFKGERVGMSFFNSGSRLIFPLTSDYTLVKSQVEHAANVMKTKDLGPLFRLIAGTETGVGTYGTSLIGDGLAACLTSFDFADQERARSVIFATDNRLAGQSVFTLGEAVERAKDAGVRVHGIYIAGAWSDDDAGMKDVLTAHGMYYYPFTDISDGSRIVQAVQAQDVQNVKTDGEAGVVDQPGHWPALIAGAFLVFLAVAWRFKL